MGHLLAEPKIGWEVVSTGIYARVSTDKEEQDHALTQQLTRLRLAAQGQEVIEYIEKASGSRDDRRQLKRLLKDCRSGLLTTVICTKLDRLSRSVAHGAELLTYFAAEDTPNLIALDDGLDLSTVGGRFVANMLVNLAQAEVERLAERTSHGMADRKRLLKPFGPPPFGYRFTPDHSNIELDPVTASLARKLVATFLEERSLLGVLRLHQREGLVPFRSSAGFKSWLLNPTLAGYRVYGHSLKQRDQSGRLMRRHRGAGDYGELYPNVHPALISQQEHELIRKIVANQRQRGRSALVPGRVNVLTGLVRCGHCGRKMGYQSARNKPNEYVRCSGVGCECLHLNRVRSDKVEAAIWDALKGHQQQLLMVEMANQLKTKGLLQQEHALQEQIKELEAMNDPDLAEAINHKRLRLLGLLEQRNDLSDLEYSPEQVTQAFGDELFWDNAQKDREVTRNLFVEHVQEVVVLRQEVDKVLLRLGAVEISAD